MIDLIKELPVSLVVAFTSAAIFAFIVLVAVIVWAILQGREFSLWPPKVSPRNAAEQQADVAYISIEYTHFLEQLVGEWWSLRDWDPNTVDFMTIAPYRPTAKVQIAGVAYNENGDEVAS